MAREQRDRTVLIVNEENQNLRADQALTELLQISRSQVQKLLKAGCVSKNGKELKGKEILSLGDEVVVEGFQSINPLQITPTQMQLDIVYEDESVLVVNKAAGIVVHPGAGTTEPTLIEGILFYLSQDVGQMPGDPVRPGIVHRLDKDTSGVMVIAKDAQSHEHLSTQFKDKTNLREYLALMRGRMIESEIECESYLYRDPRHRTRFASMPTEEYEALEIEESSNYRFAKSTFYKKKTYADQLTLAQVRLHTGRTHQIRVHARSLKLPIVGDKLYGSQQNWGQLLPKTVIQKLSSVKRQMLHARLLGFTHPKSNEKLGFEVPIPDDMKEVIICLEEHLK